MVDKKFSQLPEITQKCLRAGVKAIRRPGRVRAEHLEFATNMYIWSEKDGKIEIAKFRDAMWRVAKGNRDLYGLAMSEINKLYYEHESAVKQKAKKSSCS